MPPGGGGFYYFSVYLTTNSAETAYFDVEISGQHLCSAVGELGAMIGADEIMASCSGMAEVAEGKAIYHPQLSYVKVMFLHLCVIPFTGQISVQGSLCSGGSLSKGSLCPGGLCPQGSLSKGGFLSKGGLCPRGISVWRFCKEGGLCPERGLCPEKGLCVDRGLCPERDLCPRGSLSRKSMSGVSYWNAFLFLLVLLLAYLE